MDFFTFLFCWVPIGTIVLAVLMIIGVMQETIRAERMKDELLAAKLEAQRARTEELLQRKAISQELREAKLIAEHNRAQKLEIEIEVKNLQRIKLERELNINQPEFKPEDYE